MCSDKLENYIHGSAEFTSYMACKKVLVSWCNEGFYPKIQITLSFHLLHQLAIVTHFPEIEAILVKAGAADTRGHDSRLHF
jgi:hypothetical protein